MVRLQGKEYILSGWGGGWLGGEADYLGGEAAGWVGRQVAGWGGRWLGCEAGVAHSGALTIVTILCLPGTIAGLAGRAGSISGWCGAVAQTLATTVGGPV